MPFTITVAQRKGGAGKTTLCCQLTACLIARGLAVGAVDMDDQRSFTRWAETRKRRYGELDFDIETSNGYAVGSSVRRSRAADIVIIDTPPSVEPGVTRAIGLADLVIAPLQLTPLDLDASLPTAKAIGRARVDALFVINRAPPRARVADRIRSEIRRQGLPTASVELGSRAAFAESIADGLGVVESERSGKAAAEIIALTDEICRRAKTARAAA
ncbi:MAG: AAA family ATPase [Alphaproteobacteria bacterium]|nr:AAA family ATPase [Alphaproteobacteria bacterium]